MKNKVIRLEADDTKDKEPRIIPICQEFFDVLRTIPRGVHDDHVFLYEGKPIKNIRRTLRRTCKDAKIVYGRKKQDGFVFHDFRHCFNTYMRKSGVPESVIMRITGHSSREMFDRYNRVDEQDMKNAVAQMRTFLASVDQNIDQTPHLVSEA